jgi:hypothetical protein
MPSSHVCSEDSSLELQRLQIKAKGAQANRKRDECFGEAFFSLISLIRSFEVASLATASLSTGFPPAVAALASSLEEVDSPPNFESFGVECFS